MPRSSRRRAARARRTAAAERERAESSLRSDRAPRVHRHSYTPAPRPELAEPTPPRRAAVVFEDTVGVNEAGRWPGPPTSRIDLFPPPEPRRWRDEPLWVRAVGVAILATIVGAVILVVAVFADVLAAAVARTR